MVSNYPPKSHWPNSTKAYFLFILPAHHRSPGTFVHQGAWAHQETPPFSIYT